MRLRDTPSTRLPCRSRHQHTALPVSEMVSGAAKKQCNYIQAEVVVLVGAVIRHRVQSAWFAGDGGANGRCCQALAPDALPPASCPALHPVPYPWSETCSSGGRDAGWRKARRGRGRVSQKNHPLIIMWKLCGFAGTASDPTDTPPPSRPTSCYGNADPPPRVARAIKQPLSLSPGPAALPDPVVKSPAPSGAPSKPPSKGFTKPLKLYPWFRLSALSSRAWRCRVAALPAGAFLESRPNLQGCLGV